MNSREPLYIIIIFLLGYFFFTKGCNQKDSICYETIVKTDTIKIDRIKTISKPYKVEVKQLIKEVEYIERLDTITKFDTVHYVINSADTFYLERDEQIFTDTFKNDLVELVGFHAANNLRYSSYDIKVIKSDTIRLEKLPNRFNYWIGATSNQAIGIDAIKKNWNFGYQYNFRDKENIFKIYYKLK